MIMNHLRVVNISKPNGFTIINISLKETITTLRIASTARSGTVLWYYKQARLQNYMRLNCPPRNQAGVSGTGKIRPNIKFVASWCVTKIKVDPESWLKKTLH